MVSMIVIGRELRRTAPRQVLRLLLAILIAGCASTTPSNNGIKRLDGSKIEAQELTARIEELTKKAGVHGLAIAIFNDREIVYSRAFGVKRTDTGEPLRMDTEFYGASLSKAVSAVLMMKLVEDGILDLDAPLVSYLDRPIETYTASREKA